MTSDNSSGDTSPNRGWRDRIGRAADGFRRGTKDARTAVGDTRVGGVIGKATRTAAKQIRELPGISVIADTALERNGVPQLLQARADHPDDPLVVVLLAEAMHRTHADVRKAAVARTVLNPWSAVVRAAMRTAVQLGQEDSAAPPTQLRKRAWALAQKRLAIDARDKRAWHALARIYLAQGRAVDAIPCAQRAVAAQPHESSDELVTLARAYLALRQLDAARQAALRAVDAGSSMGYAVIGQVELRDESVPAKARQLSYAANRAKVLAEDRARYRGIDHGAAAVARRVAGTQADRSRKFGSQSTSVARGVRDRFRRG